MNITNTQNIDFNALVQNNPINISVNYQNELVKKLSESFTEDQEKWYVANLYAYLNYHPINDYVIDIENVFEMIGFSNKRNAKRTLMNNFIKGEDFKGVLLPREQYSKGGKPEERITLNISTFKELCLLAKTDKGKQIRKYYIKLEIILNELFITQSKEYEQQLVKQKALIETQQEDNKKLQEEKKLEKHNMLLQEYGDFGHLVYIIKVKTFDDNTYVIKIGESRVGIRNRYNEHRKNYEECLVLDCFSVKNSVGFEKFLHDQLRLYKVTDLKTHEKEKELFLIGDGYSYKQLVDVIKYNIKYYNDDYTEIEKLRLENENLKMLMNTKKDYDLKNDREMLTNINNKIDKLEARIIENKELIISRTAKMTTIFAEPSPHIGPRLQQINPETLTLVKVFDSVAECLISNRHIKRSSISKAVSENTIYKGFRWNFVDRALDATIIEELPPTKVTRLQNVGYIAKMDITKSNIINIYLDRKTAATLNNYQSHSSLDNIVKHCKLSNGNYYILYDNLTPEVKEKYITPILYKDGIGKFDIEGNLLAEFTCKYDCVRNQSLSAKSLAKALRTGMTYDGYFYRMIGEKLSC